VKKLIALLLPVFCATLSCRQETEQPSLSDETLARIMADLYVAEAATNGLGGYEKDSLTHAYYEQVFEIHGVTKNEYEKNVRLISQNELHIGEVADSAIAILKMMNDE